MRSKVVVRRKLFRTLLEGYLKLGEKLMNTQQVLARYTPEWKKEVDDFQAECDARGLTIAHDVTEDVMRTIELGDYDSARNLLQGILDLF